MTTGTDTLRRVRADYPAQRFAGFTWPRLPAMRPRQPLAVRLHDYKTRQRLTGPYYQPAPRFAGDGAGFYLESDGAPGLRWYWCDELADGIRHTGWFADPYGDGDTIRGIVLALPHGRGYLAGWSMGEGMASTLEPEIYDDEISAALAADSLAEYAAERERTYQEELDAERETVI